MPTQRLAQFKSDIRRSRDLVGLGQAIGSMTHGLVDASDLYRAAIVQAIAALDSYIHGVVLDRAVDILTGRLPSGSRTKVGLNFGAISDIMSATTPADMELLARTHIAQRLALETFQKPDDIADALAMVGIGKIWSTAFQGNAFQTKTALSLIVDRRNRIVHSCDLDPLSPGQVTALDDTDAIAAVGTVESTIDDIDKHC